MSYNNIYSDLNSSCRVRRTEAVGMLYERHYETLRKRAFRYLRLNGFTSDVIEQATELALTVFERLLQCAATGVWPGDRALAPWTDDESFEAYWTKSIENRSISSSIVSRKTVIADVQENAAFANSIAPDSISQFDQGEANDSEPSAKLTHILDKIHIAAKSQLTKRHYRVIPVMARIYLESGDDLPLSEIYKSVAATTGLGSPSYVSNCWSEGVKMVKGLFGENGNKLAADLLAKAAVAEGFPVAS